MHGVRRDDGSGDAEFAEQGLQRRDFVGLFIAIRMAEHEGGCGREGIENMGRLAIVEVIETMA